MYDVTTDTQSEPQIDALPPHALSSFAEAWAVLEVAPWNGDPINDRDRDAPVRTLTFGPTSQGMITYLILERDRRVDILDVLWID